MTEPLRKPRIRRGRDVFIGRWVLSVPDQGSAHATIEPFSTFEAALDGLADWWAHGNRASFLRHPGYGHDRRRDVVRYVAEQHATDQT
jgi:hypothetical protein